MMTTPPNPEEQTPTVVIGQLKDPNKYKIERHAAISRPPGAIKLSKDEVINLQKQRIKNWVPQSEIWPLKYGVWVCPMVAGLTGFVTNGYFRKRFHLKNFGRFATLSASVGIPVISTNLITGVHIQKKLYLLPNCPVCLEIQGGVFQTMAIIHSMVCTILIAMVKSRQYHTYHDLKKSEAFKPTIIHGLKSSPKTKTLFTGLLGVNFAVGFFMTYWQGRTLDKLDFSELIDSDSGEKNDF